MNLPLSLPSPPLWAGERVAEGRVRGGSEQVHGPNAFEKTKVGSP